jgi:hypothetical protein
MEEVIVRTWSQLEERLYEGSWREEIGRFRSTQAYRGAADARHDLRTSLARLGDEKGVQLENHLLRNFRKYAQREAAAGASIWHCLALAQHHGLPTRLLDWTYSPLVALHFATDRVDCFDIDGAVWCVDYARTNELLPSQLRALLHEEGAHTFSVEMLQRAACSLADFDALGSQDSVAFFEPPSLDDRIVNQFGLFSLLSSPTLELTRWLSARRGVARKLIVPARLKREIRDKLDQANITERLLYPGLDGLSRWLTRYYTPKPRER